MTKYCVGYLASRNRVLAGVNHGLKVFQLGYFRGTRIGVALDHDFLSTIARPNLSRAAVVRSPDTCIFLTPNPFRVTRAEATKARLEGNTAGPQPGDPCCIKAELFKQGVGVLAWWLGGLRCTRD